MRRQAAPVQASWLAGILLLAGVPAAAQGILTTFAGTDWVFTGDGRRALDAPLGWVYGLSTDAAGNLYAADSDNQVVVRIDPAGVLTVVAGNGVRGHSGDGGLARSAALNVPMDVVAAPDGSLYIAERLGHRIRRVSPSGTISTIAGNGEPGFSGDGGPAAQAQLNQPRSLALDRGGNLYILDRDNGRVRRIDRQGIITTVAGNGRLGYGGDGGPALQASIYPQFGIAVDIDGNLYISDFENHRVRRVNPQGVITTYAGTGRCDASPDGVQAASAPICIPRGITTDNEGNVYFVDNNRVRRVNRLGVATTVAGTGRYLFGGDGGPARLAYLRSPYGIALDNAGRVYVSDRENLRIRRVDLQGVINTIAGNAQFRQAPDGTPATAAYFYRPQGLAFDASGNLYGADYRMNRIRKITPAGAFSTLAGTGAAACCIEDGQRGDPILSGPVAIVFDRNQNLYFSDTNNGRVRRITPGGVIDTVAGMLSEEGFSGDNGPATRAVFLYPTGLAFDSTGNLYIADSGNARVRRVDTGGVITTFAGNGTPGFSGDNGPATQASLNEPYALAFDRGGNLLIADAAGNRVRRVTPNGVISTVAGTGREDSTGDGGPASQASLNSPRALAVDAEGNIYVAEYVGDRVRRISPDGRITTVAGTGITGFRGDGGPPTAGHLAGPQGLAIDARGDLYIGDSENHRIRVIRRVAPAFQVSPSAVSLTAAEGSAVAPVTLRVSTDFPGLQFTAAATTESGGNWLRVEPASGNAPQDIAVAVDASSLAPGEYAGAVTVTSPLASPSSRRVAVTLRVQPSLPPKLSVGSESLTFTFVRDGGSSAVTLSVANQGGGTLEFRAMASLAPGEAWLAVSPESGVAAPTAPASVTVAASPAGLEPGVYSATLTISSATDVVRLPVTMTVAGASGKILLSQTGLSFIAVAGGGAPSPQPLGVLNETGGGLSYEARASTLTGGDWLRISRASGRVDRALLDVSLLDVSVNARGLAPGVHYGRVEITAAAGNSPQFCTVILTVLPEGSNPGPEVRPSGLIFAGLPGQSPGSQDVNVTNLLGRPSTYASSRLTLDGAPWFTHTPPNGQAPPGQQVRIVVQPDYTGLSPGVRRGALTLQFDDGSIRAVSLLTVVAPPGSGVKADGRDAVGCASPNLRVEITSLRDGFTAIIGQPTTVEARIVDECGNLLVRDARAGTDVFASASNGDPDIPLTHIGNGVWTATWRPVRAATGRVLLTVTALLLQGRTAQGGRAARSGSLESSSTPIVPPGALRHAASFASGAPVAPGELISVFGANLGEREGSVPGLPLPFQLNDTEVLLAGRPLPLLYVSPSQINAQIPYSLVVNTQHQVVVRRGGTLSVPESFTVAAAQPGIFTKNEQGFGQAFALKADGATLAEPGSPAVRGEEITLFCTGLGEVDPAVTPGEAAPTPAPRTVNPVAVTIGGVEAEVRFSGLAAGFAGRYEVRVVIPESAPSGGEVALLVKASGRASQPATIAVE